MDYKKYIADVKDFPIEGILFRDITPLMANGEAFKAVFFYQFYKVTALCIRGSDYVIREFIAQFRLQNFRNYKVLRHGFGSCARFGDYVKAGFFGFDYV